MSLKSFLLSVTLTLCCSPLVAEELTIAVASNFVRPMKNLVNDFEASSGHKVSVSYGSSGRLYAQIISGAPFQLFFSADQEKPQALVDAGVAVASSQYTYAVGSLVLWWPDSQSHPKDALDAGSLKRIAIANPRLAPYGKAAMQVLESLGLASTYEKQLVMGENINQAYQFVSTGNADAGFIASSQLLREDGSIQGTAWIVPDNLHTPISQDAVITKAGQGSQVAKEFMEYMQSSAARMTITRFGYSTD